MSHAETKPRGRPSIYTDELAAEICRRLAAGETLRAICRDDDMPAASTVLDWADSKKEFSEQYAKARETGYLGMADELLEIADDGSNDWMERRGEENAGWQANGEAIGRSRLRVDTRKWLLSKCLPKVYGDKLSVDGDHKLKIDTSDTTPLELARGLAFVLALAQREAGAPTAAPAASPIKH